MRRNIILRIAFIFVLQVLIGRPTKIQAQVGDAWDLIAEVNALRASYGLTPYEVNNALMSAAQKHSNYQAQIGSWTHTGPGGSRPHDRAVAAGYGGGAQVYISENVAMGVNLSPYKTVYEMWQDAIHLETMTSSLYKHIGAGVGISGDYVYYTIDVGYIAGAPGGGDGNPPEDEPPPGGDGGAPAATIIPQAPIVVSTSGPDGAIYHVVQWGQFLENIAEAYHKPLNDILKLNGLTTETIIYPGDKLLIQPGRTPKATLEEEISPTQVKSIEPTRTPDITRTPRPQTTKETPLPIAMGIPEDAVHTSGASVEAGEPGKNSQEDSNYLLYAVFGLAVTGTAMILLGNSLKRRT